MVKTTALSPLGNDATSTASWGWSSSGRGGASGSWGWSGCACGGWADGSDQGGGWSSGGRSADGGRGGNWWVGSGGSRLPDRWAGDRVGSWLWEVNIDENSGVSRLVTSWELDSWPWGSVSTVNNVDLRTAHVVLRPVRRSRSVETDVLKTEKVLARWSVLWNGKVPWTRGHVPVKSVRVDGGGAELENLEPVSVTVPGRDVGSRWSLSEVGHVWARVDDSLIGRESNLGTGSYGEGLTSSRWVDVAANGFESDIFNWAVVVDWSPLADILELGSWLSIDVESGETV